MRGGGRDACGPRKGPGTAKGARPQGRLGSSGKPKFSWAACASRRGPGAPPPRGAPRREPYAAQIIIRAGDKAPAAAVSRHMLSKNLPQRRRAGRSRASKNAQEK